MSMLIALAMCAAAAIAPLTESQRTALVTARDGADHTDEAFAALVANAAQWTAGAGEVLVRLEPDVDAMLADPQRYRGDVCRIVGIIQQQTRLESPFQSVSEWFVRDALGRPLLVYVTGVADSGDPGGYRDGQRVQVYARFYKRVNAKARDENEHSYAAFVGALPHLADSPPLVGGPWLGTVVIPVAALLVAFIVVLWYVRRVRRQRRTRTPAASGHTPVIEVDGGPPLPDDPEAALDELRRRAEADRR